MRPKLRLLLATTVAAAAIAAGGIAVATAEKPGLQSKIDSAESGATLIAQRISTQGARIADLQAEAEAAAAREAELRAQLAEATTRSTELNEDLVAAERVLDAVRARYDRSVGVLSARLVAIYKSPEPDVLGVILDAEDYDELEGRATYLEALTDADERVAGRVAALHDEVDARYDEIAGLKAELDQERQRLGDARDEIAAGRAAASERAGEIAAAKAEAESALSDLRERISGWELEVRKQAAAQIAEDGGEGAYLGGPYSIPTYIVMCESGGNYRALNPSSGAGGAYQIIPSTWRAYGGRGQPHEASKAEQDRIAAIIWREDGPGAWSCA